MTQSNDLPMAPPAPPAPAVPVRQRVEEVINYLRPMLQSDGGDLELVDVSPAGVVSVRLHGACAGCPGASATLRMGVERHLRAKVPEVTELIRVSDLD